MIKQQNMVRLRIGIADPNFINKAKQLAPPFLEERSDLLQLMRC